MTGPTRSCSVLEWTTEFDVVDRLTVQFTPRRWKSDGPGMAFEDFGKRLCTGTSMNLNVEIGCKKDR